MGNPDSIPFLDLVTPHQQLEEELVSAFRKALRTAAFVGGPAVETFESAFAAFCGTRHCVAVNSGTDALRFALIAAGVKSGDVVITVPNTFIATTEAISQAGALPEFVDIDERTYNMDPGKLRQYLESKCRVQAGRLISLRSGRPVTAIVPVHLYGQTADMNAINEAAAKYRLVVIEDACQAHGAEYFSSAAGSIGRAAAFSFYPGKNLGACGEGGAITTNDEELAHVTRMLRDHGQSKKYFHDLEGYNGRLDSIQTAILSIKLDHLGDWNRRRREAAAKYNSLFAAVPDVVTPYEPEYSTAVYHLYVIRVQNRPGLQAHLNETGIGTGIHYPVPLHMQNAYKNLGYQKGDFPITERVANEIVSLPMFPTITAEQQQRVVDAVAAFQGKTRAATVSVRA